MHMQNNGLNLITSVFKINSMVSKLTCIFAIFSRYQAAHFTINKKNYNMIHHLIIGGFIDVYIVVRFVSF